MRRQRRTWRPGFRGDVETRPGEGEDVEVCPGHRGEAVENADGPTQSLEDDVARPTTVEKPMLVAIFHAMLPQLSLQLLNLAKKFQRPTII